MALHLKYNQKLWPPFVRALCIDHGTKTLGLAISNSEQTVVTPMETLHRTKWVHDKGNLDKIFSENDIGAVIIGYPLNMDGSAGARCQSVKDFVVLMEQEWPNMAFFFYDERLSTANVDKFLDNDKSKTRAKRKIFKDALAAQVILEEALEWLHREKL